MIRAGGSAGTPRSSVARCCPRCCGASRSATCCTASFFTFLNPYALLGGVTTLTLFTLHGALFLALKTTGDLRARANRTAAIVGLAAIVAGAGFLAWTEASYRASTTTGAGIASVALAALAAVALITAVGASRIKREGVAFAANATAIAAATATLFTALYPNVLPSSTSALFSLTTANAASTAKTLMVMTVVALIFLPLVLAYQAWTYWVFRKRVMTPPSRPSPPRAPSPPTAPGPPTAPSPRATRKAPW
jgi:cytochrome d ubiquinol oxidase subunit II